MISYQLSVIDKLQIFGARWRAVTDKLQIFGARWRAVTDKLQILGARWRANRLLAEAGVSKNYCATNSVHLRLR
jgi:hypothetical protein